MNFSSEIIEIPFSWVLYSLLHASKATTGGVVLDIILFIFLYVAQFIGGKGTLQMKDKQEISS